MEKALIESFEKIYIRSDSQNSDLAQRVLGLFPADKVSIVDEDPFPNHKGRLSRDQFDQSKRTLLIKPFHGQFFKRCPGASQKKTLSCCNYHVLNLGQQCNMNCSYCYLQSYLNSPTMVAYSNIDQALLEIEQMANEHPDHPFRVGTGEVIDSLSLDELTLHSRTLIQFFKRFPKWTLEFKSKSDKVDQFLDCEHSGNVIVSWSINSEEITRTEEHGTASLQQRLTAARKCRDRGYQIAFHLDPLIYYKDWKTGYADLVDQITSQFKSHEVNVISLGALRFQPEQRHMMRERFGLHSKVVSGEMFLSEGNKLRYDANVRREMFDFVLSQFRERDRGWRTFLCMETPESWISSYDQHPMKVDGLKELFRPLPKIRISEESAPPDLQ